MGLSYQREWEHASKYRFKLVEQFEEPLFSTLFRNIFFESFPSIDMQKVLTEQEKLRDQELKARIVQCQHPQAKFGQNR